MIDRLFVAAEDLWSWVHEALGEVDQDVLEALDDWGLDDDEPRPGTLLMTFVPAGGDPSPFVMVWGVPSPWDPGDPLLYTIHSETALREPPWTDWLGVGRCVIPISAYWTRAQPGARVRLRGGEPTALAALYGPGGSPAGQYGCAILTTAAGEDRQPVIVPREHVRRWLDPEIADPGLLEDLLQPLDAGSLLIELVEPETSTAASASVPEREES